MVNTIQEVEILNAFLYGTNDPHVRVINPLQAKGYDNWQEAIVPQGDYSILTNADFINWANELEAQRTTEQILETAQSVTRKDIIVRIRSELESATPDWATLYTDVRDFVLSNPRLTQALQNRVILHETAYGISIDTGTLQGKARYLDIALTLISLYL